MAIPERPTRHSENVINYAAHLLAKRVIQHEPEFGDDPEGVESDLRAALKYDSDGYELGRALYNKGWTIDAHMVELLDGGCLSEAEDKAVTDWVIAYGVAPKITEIGAPVKFTKNHSGSGEVLDGFVCEINARRGTYGVSLPDKWNAETRKSSSWYVVPFSVVEKLTLSVAVA